MRAGQNLLHYRVAEKVGAGGMGEVWRAHDTRLARSVAIKVLPAELRDDPQRLARLEREARMLASLNHRHVATVHGLEQAEDGTRFLVMELVEGESLAARLERGSLPLAQVYDLGAQVADALAAAHARGIVHRDLKPANIMLTRQGIKLIDFGLAKAVELPSAAAHAATETLAARPAALTGEGAFVGTFQYMSPEQLEGQEADARADVFAFGAVLYEMATGRKAFQGRSAASLIAAILSGERPSIARHLPLAPPALDRLVRTCLAREPDERWQSARDVGLQLKWIAEGAASTAAAAGVATSRGLAGRIGWAIAALALAAGGWFAFRPFERPARPAHVARFPLSLQGEKSEFTRVSPDGRHFAATIDSGGRQQIWLRSMDDLEARPLPGTEGAWGFFWSPDSRSIGFFAEGKLKKLAIDGGLPQRLCDAPGAGPAQLGAWGRDGTILFGIGEVPGHADGLYRVSADGGTATPVALHDHETGAPVPHSWPYWPSFLPDGRHFLSLCEPADGEYATCITALESGRTRRLLDVPSYAQYTPPGTLLYTRRGVLVAQAFDLDTLTVRGETSPIVDRAPQWVGLGIPFFSASNDGVLVYDAPASESRLSWKDRNGVVIGQVGPQADYDELRIAPDGSQVAVTITDARSGSAGIWLIDVARNVSTRFTIEENDEASAPVWSPDGRSLAFCMSKDNPPNLHLKPVAGGDVQELVPSRDTLHWAFDWSPDGRFLFYGDRDATTDWDLWVLPLEGEREPFPFVRTRYAEHSGVFSPDGHWVAYVSNETGQREVYVERFPEPGDRRRVSTAGGSSPRWPRAGGELFYITPDDQLMAVPATSGTSLELGTPVRLFGPVYEFDVSADGLRFLATAPLPGASSAPTVVLNWNAELRR
jgi:Tol biopolymer transport system component